MSKLFKVLILTSIVALLVGSVNAQSFSYTVASTELINFYSMTSVEVQTFVNILNNQGISLVVLRLNAFSEFQSGTSSGIAKTKEFIVAANNVGINVAVDLHSWYTTWDNYFDDSASNYASYRSQYLTYVQNVVSSFSDSNVYAFMVLNEPQYQYATASENQFILDCVNTAKTVTSKPVSVRFMGGASPYGEDNYHYSTAIADAVDYYCINTYWDPRNPTVAVYSCTQADITNTIANAHNNGKAVWVTEFGKTNSNTEEQRAYVEAWVTWANSNNVDAIFCWVSQPENSAAESYNIFSDYTPLPAFYELTNTIIVPTPTPTATPYPTSTPTPTAQPTPTPIGQTPTPAPTNTSNDYTVDEQDLTNTGLILLCGFFAYWIISQKQRKGR